ncbi:MAG: zinc-dependent alcohol dehydrogenase [Candidatus Dormibacteraceae bacterium]
MPEPSAGPGQALIEVRAAGICGTDLHISEGSFASRPPVTMGHEVAGVVAAVGEDVEREWVGRPVVCETFFSTCGVCRWCRAGRLNLCPRRQSIGSGVDGGFAPLLVVPARNLHGVPRSIGLNVAALAEPLACVCQSLFDPNRVEPGDDVLVTGPGPMGLLAAQAVRAAGGRVLMVGTDHDQVRLAAARKLGFRTTLAGDDVGTRELGEGDGPQVVVECSGNAQAMAAGLEALARGGTYVQIGQTDQAVPVRLAQASFHELTISGGFASTPRSWSRALSLLAGGQVQLEPLVSEMVPLDDWQRAFAGTAAACGIKYLLNPRGSSA